MSAALLISTVFAASIVTCFAPEEDCAGLAISAIDAAQHDILVNAYAGIPAALIRAHARGVDARARVAHEKALILDRRVTILGSYNWSKGAASNSEDLNVVTSSEVAEAFARHSVCSVKGMAGPVRYYPPNWWHERFSL
jgi:phosphatidylserine/phosphatidylglycerophosphate/cardiolipin synthase-like enzyme